MTRERSGSVIVGLTRLGFADGDRARRLLDDPALATLFDSREHIEDGGLAQALGETPDPDLALLGLVRLMESAARGDADTTAYLTTVVRDGARGRDRLLAVLGASSALADHLVAHPDQVRDLVGAAPTHVEDRTERLVHAVRHPATTPEDALRVEYRRQLLGIAALDLTAPGPTQSFPFTSAALADLAEAALEAALALAVDELGESASRTRLAVIGMGKTGGRELNYISDVDVVFVAEPVDGVPEDEALALATTLATRLMKACSAATPAGTLWEVDPALRPEGKAGPLVRTVSSHLAYYQRWAKTWEFQALLKARPVAGDREVGDAYVAALAPLVWAAVGRPNFVDDVQAMRRRVESHVPSAEADRQLKLGVGGLRDVEFSVQLLQLVHGRSDVSLRSSNTLEALAALSRGGYVGREDAATLDAAYRLLRSLEHRIQLVRLRRTHLMPTAAADLRRLGRSLGHRSDPETAVVAQWRAQAREVRRLHERIFYRPLLSAVARLSTEDSRLTPEAARERLHALGFRNPTGALKHLEALTEGVSRRAAIQRQLLPAMLGWFADEADPDAGLLAFRRVSEELGTTHWYLRLLRDEGTAAERLAHVLGRSRFAADLLEQAPECVQFLGEDVGLVPRGREELVRRMRQAAARREDPAAAVLAARLVRRAELFRVAVGDLTGELTLEAVGEALTDLVGALMEVALEQSRISVEARTGTPVATRLLVVGMGRLGGRETGWSSDADVLFVHEPLPGADEVLAQQQALDVVKEFLRLLALRGPDPRLDVDADLRPEGKNGPLIRSLASYREYYARWSLVWESQALVRALPLAGDAELGERFVQLVDPLRWRPGGLTGDQVREIRLLKARMEAERLPRGADRKTHLKLGPGGLSDVEWTVQLLQMQHAGAHPELRTTSTLPALRAAVDLGLLGAEDGTALEEAWRLATRLRNAGGLLRGRTLDALPSDARDLDGIARIIGLPPQSGQELAETYRRVARHARTAAEESFYGSS